MNRTIVESSNLESIGYTGVLEVRFKGGGTYQYLGVPEDVYKKLLEAESKGAFLNSEIKNKYPFQLVTIKGDDKA